jgi:hypothetical protein
MFSMTLPVPAAQIEFIEKFENMPSSMVMSLQSSPPMSNTVFTAG